MAKQKRRFDPKHKEILLAESRAKRWDPPNFLRQLEVQPGQLVLELGCGPGFWTLPLADLVGQGGKVWALDASEEMLNALLDRHPPAQVQPVRTELPAIPLPDDAIDLAWAAFIFHQIGAPQRLANEVRRVISPGGRAVVLDWRPDAKGDQGPPRAYRRWPVEVIRWLRRAGFDQVVLRWEDEDAYMIQATLRN